MCPLCLCVYIWCLLGMMYYFIFQSFYLIDMVAYLITLKMTKPVTYCHRFYYIIHALSCQMQCFKLFF